MTSFTQRPSFQDLVADPSWLEQWGRQATHLAAQGRLPDYIPLLATAQVDGWAVALQTIKNSVRVLGDRDRPVVLMSVVKPFVLLYLLEQVGWESVFQWVGWQPSDQPFYSLAQLQADQGFPRNPMLNSGAIALAGRLPGQSGTERCEALRQWLNQQSGATLVLDQAMLASVESLANETNRAIADRLVQAGYLNDVETAIDTYNRICCLSGTVEDLGRVGLLLVADSICDRHRRAVNALMLSCGLYETSGWYAMRVGLPMKSGVSGLILAVVPNQGVIVCYGPALDTTGNSLVGLALLEELVQRFDLSPF